MTSPCNPHIYNPFAGTETGADTSTPRAFKCGDRVRATSGAPTGKLGQIVYKSGQGSMFAVLFENWMGGHKCGSEWGGGCMNTGKSGWYMSADELELAPSINNKGDKMSKLSAKQKQVLSKDLQNMYELGWLNDDLTLNHVGVAALLNVLADQNEATLGKLAAAELKELKKA